MPAYLTADELAGSSHPSIRASWGWKRSLAQPGGGSSCFRLLAGTVVGLSGLRVLRLGSPGHSSRGCRDASGGCGRGCRLRDGTVRGKHGSAGF